MSDKPKVYVAGVGMITSVGGNVDMTAASVRAGINRYEETDYYNKRYEPMKMALVPNDALPPLNEKLEDISGITARQIRMLRLATPALQEVLSTVPLKESVPLFLAGPETLPGCPKAIDSKFINHLITQTGASIDGKLSRIIATGRAGGVQAIDLAFKYFETGEKDVALIGGVDSCLDHYMLGMLDSEDRILASGVMEAFAPGEAAGFLLLVSERVVEKLSHKPLAILSMPGISDEIGHRYSEEPYRGDGLAMAFNNALDSVTGQRMKAIYSSMNGESFGAKELGIAVIRNKDNLEEDYSLEHPADCFGDIGAAFGPVLLGLISRNEPGTYLGYCSSDRGARAAITVVK